MIKSSQRTMIRYKITLQISNNFLKQKVGMFKIRASLLERFCLKY